MPLRSGVARGQGWPIWSWSLLRMRRMTPISAMMKTKASTKNAALTKIDPSPVSPRKVAVKNVSG